MKSLGLSPNLCERMAQTPVSDVSTFILKDLDGSECLRVGEVVKAVLSRIRTCSAAEFHIRHLGFPHNMHMIG